jgi:hypothetical protein
MAAELVVVAVDIAIDGRVGRLRFAAQREGAAMSAGTGMASRRSATSAWAFAASSPGVPVFGVEGHGADGDLEGGRRVGAKDEAHGARGRRPRLARNGRRSARGRGRSARRCSRRRCGQRSGCARRRRARTCARAAQARAARPGRRGRGRRRGAVGRRDGGSCPGAYRSRSVAVNAVRRGGSSKTRLHMSSPGPICPTRLGTLPSHHPESRVPRLCEPGAVRLPGTTQFRPQDGHRHRGKRWKPSASSSR